MARKATMTRSKKKGARATRRVTGMNAIPTSSWNHAKYYVHYEVESREWLSTMKDYIRNNLDKKDVAAINKLPDWKIGFGSHWATVAKLREVAEHLIPTEMSVGFDNRLTMLVEEGKAIIVEKKAEEKSTKVAYKPSIQERIAEQANEACEDIEAWFDEFITDPKKFNAKSFDFTGHFTLNKVTQAHARKIKKQYEGQLTEAQAVVNLPTPAQIKKMKGKKAEYAQQLREGYAHLRKADATKWLDALETLMAACDMVIDAAKATRKPRVKKAPSKEKLIAKVQYKETDDKYKLASVNPINMLDSEEIWVFNVKTRKLGKYIADEHAKTMSIKGTTIVGFDETLSVQKTLRKPDDTLKEFKKAGKVKLRKFLEELTTTDTKLNGRLNSDTIILQLS